VLWLWTVLMFIALRMDILRKAVTLVSNIYRSRKIRNKLHHKQ
jgi:hypothetical protein